MKPTRIVAFVTTCALSVSLLTHSNLRPVGKDSSSGTSASSGAVAVNAEVTNDANIENSNSRDQAPEIGQVTQEQPKPEDKIPAMRGAPVGFSSVSTHFHLNAAGIHHVSPVF